jgi:hypothetical protein
MVSAFVVVKNMGKKKGDKVVIAGFEGIIINEIKEKFINNATRVSFQMKDGTKFWIVVPNELIIKREKRD